mgnify:CR=1 FL=1
MIKMENKKVSINFGGIGTLLTIAFIVLKLCGVIAWSWVWVLAPLWISVALVVLAFILVLAICSR